MATIDIRNPDGSEPIDIITFSSDIDEAVIQNDDCSFYLRDYSKSVVLLSFDDIENLYKAMLKAKELWCK